MSNQYADYAEYLLYKERPVDIDEFIVSTEFMGNITKEGKLLWPRWRKEIRTMVYDNDRYVNVLTGSIGSGKTSAAILCLAYTLYRLMCLRDPRGTFEKMEGNKLYIAFFSLTKSLSDSRGYGSFHRHLVSSPWFLSKGTKAGSEENPRLDISGFEAVVASPLMKGYGIQGLDIIAALLDEVDSPDASEANQKRVLAAYNASLLRLESRFVYQGSTPGRFFVVASKQDRLSFLNTFIAKMQNSTYVRVIDLSIWEAKKGANKNEFCGETFKVSIGDEFHPPKIIYTKDDLNEALKSGYDIINVPTEYKEKFENDTVGSLRDLAGISVSHIRKTKLFPSKSKIVKCFDEEHDNPLDRITIEIGLHDEINLVDFIDLSKIHIPRNVPRFFHQDYAYADDGDASGLAMSCIVGWKKVNVTGKDGITRTEKYKVAYTDFVIRLKAKPGDTIPQHKVRQLILDLKETYKFNIVKCTFDLRMGSHQSMQALELAGVASDHLSMDMKPDNYLNFRNMVFEERWSTPKNEYLSFELSNLEYDRVKNKVDHPDEIAEMKFFDDGTSEQVVMVGSKDCADAVGGSVISAMESSEDPPDVEIMSKLMDKVIRKPMNEGIDPLDILDIKSVRRSHDDIPEDKMPDKDLYTYTDLVKRVKNLRRGR